MQNVLGEARWGSLSFYVRPDLILSHLHQVPLNIADVLQTPVNE